MGGSAPVAGVKVMTKGTGGGFDSSDGGTRPVMLVTNPEVVAARVPGTSADSAAEPTKIFRPVFVVRLLIVPSLRPARVDFQSCW